MSKQTSPVADVADAPALPRFTPNVDFDAAFDAGQIAWIDDEVWSIVR